MCAVPHFKIIPAVYQQPAPFVPHQIMNNPVSPVRSHSPSMVSTSRVQEVPAPPKSPTPVVSLNDMSMKSASPTGSFRGSPEFLTQPSERTFPINPPTMNHEARQPVPYRQPMNQHARVPQVMTLDDREVQAIAYGYRNTGVTSASIDAVRSSSMASTGSLMNFTPSPRPVLGPRARPDSIATNAPPARRGQYNNLLNF